MPKQKANNLTGTDWLRYSISVWNDIRKTPAEIALGHPATFPLMMADRLMQCLVQENDRTVLDPFAGSGSTLLAACERGLNAIGVDLSADYLALARERLETGGYREATLDELGNERSRFVLLKADARELNSLLPPGSVDFCLTSPPYWDILRRQRSADRKTARHYGDRTADLGAIQDYPAFLDALGEVFAGVLQALRPGGYCCVVVMDLRKRAKFFPLHQDLASRMRELDFVYDDLIIWDRRAEYNNLRPLGYPYRFRINKVHEFILIFQKPARKR